MGAAKSNELNKVGMTMTEFRHSRQANIYIHGRTFDRHACKQA